MKSVMIRASYIGLSLLSLHILKAVIIYLKFKFHWGPAFFFVKSGNSTSVKINVCVCVCERRDILDWIAKQSSL